MFKNVLKMLFAAALAASFAVASSAQTKAERPEIKTGDSWEYSYRDTRYAKPGCNYSLTIKEVANDKVTGNVESPQGCDLAQLGPTPLYDRDFNPLLPGGTPVRVFDFPLEVGKTWNQEFDFSVAERQWHNNVTGKVVAVEKVTVPAGTFDAYKIVLERKYQGSSLRGARWAGTVESTSWYAPQAKNYVKRTTVDTGTSTSPIEQELLKYKVQ